MVSVIIPARNEQYLEQTLRNILDNAQGDIEIIVELDGWLPDPQIDMKDDRVIFVYQNPAIGQRACINHGVSICKGEYIMKLDAHCAVGPGFDVILAKDCKPEWTIVPRMYNLDIDTWQPKWHKRTDYMYISGIHHEKPFRAQYYGSNQPRRDDVPIDETMCCMGPGWFLRKDRFLAQGGCDEGHVGGWGQQGIEVSLKAWLSGGALMVDKNTWFAHWFRGGSYDEKYSPGFPYQISGNQQERVRAYSRDLWLNDKWPLATRKIDWLVKKFNPPGWTKNEVYMPRNATSHVHGRPVRVKNLFDNLEYYWDDRRKHRAKMFRTHAVPFFKDLAKGKTFTDEELKAHPYYTYVEKGMRATRHRHENVIKIMKDSIAVFNDIKANGMKAPIEAWVQNGKYQISRGTRRIAILHVLGKKNTALRVYKNEEVMEKLRFKKGGHITAVGYSQFRRWSWKSTDKYWMHDYLPYYDNHMPEKPEKILEIGVKDGGSLRLWHEAYPNAKIYGVDLEVKMTNLLRGVDRIHLMEGSQIDEKFNHDEVVPNGPYDIIVDDASHRPEHQVKGFELLWDSVKPGGWYVVEDVFYRNYGVKRTCSVVDLFKQKVDDMNKYLDIAEIHFYYNIMFMRKR